MFGCCNPPCDARRIDKYQFVRTLGSGGYATVKSAIHLPTNEYVAVKVISRNSIKSAEGFIKREVIAMKCVATHPNIVNLKRVFATKSNIYIVMELVTGGDLFHEVARAYLQEHRAARLFLQLVDAIGHCHNRGIAHRDLKLENVLLDSNGNPKVSDFGLSSLNASARMLTTQCGTPTFTAPEVLFGLAYDGKRADIWSLGCIMFAVLCGGLPFHEDNKTILMQKIRDVRYRRFPSHVSSLGRALIKSMLHANPMSRPSIEGLKEHPFVLKYCQSSPRIFTPSPSFRLSTNDIESEPSALQLPSRSSADASQPLNTGRDTLPENDDADVNDMRPRAIGVVELMVSNYGVRVGNMLKTRGSDDLDRSAVYQLIAQCINTPTFKMLFNLITVLPNVMSCKLTRQPFQLQGVLNTPFSTSFDISVYELLPPEKSPNNLGLYWVRLTKKVGSVKELLSFFQTLVTNESIIRLLQIPQRVS
eukprot:c23871_g1_i1.p1 GENE.c23871_g1_i1~~c23871_g1_i1.p1  ORF type:complete len:500 (+),score=119.84 c23871_g1_i1:73-1500(+)